MDDFNLDFEVIKLRNSTYDYLVIANTGSCALNYVTAEDFPSIVNGKIVFDLLLYSGIGEHRFAVMEKRDGVLVKQNIKYFSRVDASITAECIKYYALHADLIANSCLMPVEKQAMLTQIVEYFQTCCIPCLSR